MESDVVGLLHSNACMHARNDDMQLSRAEPEKVLATQVAPSEHLFTQDLQQWHCRCTVGELQAVRFPKRAHTMLIGSVLHMHACMHASTGTPVRLSRNHPLGVAGRGGDIPTGLPAWRWGIGWKLRPEFDLYQRKHVVTSASSSAQPPRQWPHPG